MGFEPYWDENKGVYIVECFNMFNEFKTLQGAEDYISGVKNWYFSETF